MHFECEVLFREMISRQSNELGSYKLEEVQKELWYSAINLVVILGSTLYGYRVSGKSLVEG